MMVRERHGVDKRMSASNQDHGAGSSVCGIAMFPARPNQAGAHATVDAARRTPTRRVN